ncbi:hypothetical protein PhCBS80983_g01928 [Powellomyces hirtus]|uniref:Uncharacterized protein n=1 Tax=Powellomyces hirtus TaxID=109895 RepID=A0A507E859_9FUNG|nr:hypothetical protein PhCBS80983_g01928 [Powellomyces hirtus]
MGLLLTRTVLAAAVLSAAAAPAVLAQSATAPAGAAPTAATQPTGSWATNMKDTKAVPIHIMHFPGDKFTTIERVHDLNPPYENTGNSLDGFSPAAYASHSTGLSSQWFKGNPNVIAAGVLSDSSYVDLAANTAVIIDRKFPLDEQFAKNEGYAFCAGHAQMADGNYLVVGGDQFWNHQYFGRNRTSDGRRDIRIAKPANGATPASMDKVAQIANPSRIQRFPNGTQTIGPVASDGDVTYYGRWYPSVITLPNEDILTIGGQGLFFKPDDPLADNPTYEIFHPQTMISDTITNITLLAEKYPINMYPVAYVLPHSGNIWLHAFDDSVVLDLVAKTETKKYQKHDLAKENGLMGRNFPFVGSNFVPMMTYKDNYKMVAWFCGGVNATNEAGQPYPREGTASYSNCPTCKGSTRCNSLDLSVEGSAWESDDMPLGRSQPTAVNLPDGTIAIVSGSGLGHQGGVYGQPIASAGVKEAVIFNPAIPKGGDGRWKIMAAAPTARHYHNSASLLEDGTVVTGGGDSQNGDDPINGKPWDMTMDVFSPPYKSIPNPPSFVLPLATATATYGQELVLQFKTPVADTIKQVSIMRYGSVTHSTNLDSRHIELEILKFAKDKVLVKLPADETIAQPGNWMVWAVDNRGAPVERSGLVNIRRSNPAVAAAWNAAEEIAAPAGTTSSSTTGAKAPSGAATVAASLSAVLVAGFAAIASVY